MKKYAIIIICFCFFLLAKGQNTSIEIGSMLRIYNDYGLLSPVLSFKHNRHSIFTGYDIINKRGYLLTGYRFFLKDSSQKFQIFIPFDFLFRSTKIYRFHETLDENNQIIETRTTLGYGIKYYITKGLNINSQTGVGLEYNLTFYDQTYNGVRQKGNRDNFDNIWYLQFGISYDISIK